MPIISDAVLSEELNAARAWYASTWREYQALLQTSTRSAALTTGVYVLASNILRGSDWLDENLNAVILTALSANFGLQIFFNRMPTNQQYLQRLSSLLTDIELTDPQKTQVLELIRDISTAPYHDLKSYPLIAHTLADIAKNSTHKTHSELAFRALLQFSAQNFDNKGSVVLPLLIEGWHPVEGSRVERNVSIQQAISLQRLQMAILFKQLFQDKGIRDEFKKYAPGKDNKALAVNKPRIAVLYGGEVLSAGVFGNTVMDVVDQNPHALKRSLAFATAMGHKNYAIHEQDVAAFRNSQGYDLIIVEHPSFFATQGENGKALQKTLKAISHPNTMIIFLNYTGSEANHVRKQWASSAESGCTFKLIAQQDDPLPTYSSDYRKVPFVDLASQASSFLRNRIIPRSAKGVTIFINPANNAECKRGEAINPVALCDALIALLPDPQTFLREQEQAYAKMPQTLAALENGAQTRHHASSSSSRTAKK